MKFSTLFPVLAAVLLLSGSWASAQDENPPNLIAQQEVVPDKAATRRQIDQMLVDLKDQKKPVDLGVCLESVELSISFGAPSWNVGDHTACRDFYADTARSLCNAADTGSATPLAAPIIADLKNALDRVKNSNDVDASAWALRYAFDKAQVIAQAEDTRVEGLVALGAQYLQRANLAEAQDAYTAAVDCMNELAGQPIAEMPMTARYAPLGLANVLVAQKKYKDASAMILKGLDLIPQWPQSTRDLRTDFGDPSNFATIMTNLTAAADQAPNDASLQFLLGYEYFFSGSPDPARQQFLKTLAIDPHHAGATAFLNQLNANSDGFAPPVAPGVQPQQQQPDGRL
jgi:tetratricopeptide (TPR) repeat protein